MSKKKTSGKYAARKKKSGRGLMIAIVIVAILLVALSAILLLDRSDETESTSAVSTETVNNTAGEAAAAQTVATIPAETSVSLGHGLYITDIGSYTGVYMEDGTDEILSGILMMVVKNDGEQDIQYAEITLPVGDETASFSLTTLPVGEKVVLLEKSRMAWNEDIDYDSCLPQAGNVAYFQQPMSLHADKLKIGIVDGAINVTNISSADIPGNIVVYYKNAAQDLYYGGITYRITIEGGLKADEIRQVMTNHASDTGSKIMFVTIAA